MAVLWTLIWPGEVKVDLADFDDKLLENLLSVVGTVTEESNDYFATRYWTLKKSNDYFATRYWTLKKSND